MLRADGIFRQQQSARDGTPDGEGPIADKFSKTILAPAIVGCGGDGDICGVGGQGVAQLTEETLAIV